MDYLHWDTVTLPDIHDSRTIENYYSQGYLATRLGYGVLQQTRSVRIDLSKFELSSENRRILRKNAGLSIIKRDLPLKEYHWSLGKCAKDFYDTKFGQGIFSTQKIKEILTDTAKSNFNVLLSFLIHDNKTDTYLGHTITHSTKNILHYSYPFYDLANSPKDIGLGMMITTLVWAKEMGLSYVYLGSLQRPADTYKLQFNGLEWFDGKTWQSDVEEVKKILKETSRT